MHGFSFMFAFRTLNRFASLPVLVFLFLASSTAFAVERKADLIVVHKQQRIMKLLSGGDLIRQYPIALGFDPQGPKRREGDGRTPEGAYRIDWRNPDSAFHLSLHIDYPRQADMPAAGSPIDPGGDIMIHGLPNGFTADRIGHPSTDWTNGCIAVSDAQIEEIWHLVDDGTAVLILAQ
jgi:murein L,D-transpeptidase YafK